MFRYVRYSLFDILTRRISRRIQGSKQPTFWLRSRDSDAVCYSPAASVINDVAPDSGFVRFPIQVVGKLMRLFLPCRATIEWYAKMTARRLVA